MGRRQHSRPAAAERGTEVSKAPAASAPGDDALRTLHQSEKLHTLTVAQLRTFLRDRGAALPSTAKKPELLLAAATLLDPPSLGSSPPTPSPASEDLAKSVVVKQKTNVAVAITEPELPKSPRLRKRLLSEQDEPESPNNGRSPSRRPTKASKEQTEEQPEGTKRGRRGGQVAVVAEAEEVQVEEAGVVVAAKRRKRATKVAKSPEGAVTAVVAAESAEWWASLVHKRPQPEWIAYNPFIMRAPPLLAGTKARKLLSWNVNGLKAVLKQEQLWLNVLAEREDPDVLCLQETKIQEKDVEVVKEGLLPGYHSYWSSSTARLGYSGVAMFSKVEPISVKYGLGVSEFDEEGRLITAEFDDFFLLTGYVPNSGDGLRRLEPRTQSWDPALANFIKELETSKPVVLTGDLNVAHREIDIHNPQGNKRSAGFTEEERQSFETLLLGQGMVDTFRHRHPQAVGYTYWGYRFNCRPKNQGWRLDYFLVSQKLLEHVHDSYTLPDVHGSDHCPIGLILKLDS